MALCSVKNKHAISRVCWSFLSQVAPMTLNLTVSNMLLLVFCISLSSCWLTSVQVHPWKKLHQLNRNVLAVHNICMQSLPHKTLHIYGSCAISHWRQCLEMGCRCPLQCPHHTVYFVRGKKQHDPYFYTMFRVTFAIWAVVSFHLMWSRFTYLCLLHFL